MKSKVAAYLALLLMLTCASSGGVSAGTSDYSDISGHWAQDAIVKWSDYGVLQGANGRFRPNDTVTRGELAAILNRILRYNTQPGYTFSDLPADKWCHDDLIALVHQNAVRYSSDKIYPDEPLQRQEAAMMIARAFRLNTNVERNAAESFTDYNTIQDWAVRSVYSLYRLGYIAGNPDGSFDPERSISRAEVVTILNNFIDTLISKPGIYELPLGQIVFVNTEGAQLVGQNLKSLFIGPNVKYESVIFRDGTCDEIHIYSQQALIINDVVSRNASLSNAKVYSVYIASDIDPRFAGGIGTEADPYIIKTEAQLRYLEDHGNRPRNNTAMRIHFRLANDIALSEPWTPLYQADDSLSDDGFQNVLDGAGYTISGLDIRAENYAVPMVGLFGKLSGKILNLTVTGSIRASASSTMTKEINTLSAGGLAGMMLGGLIENCVSNVDIEASADMKVCAGGVVGLVNAGSVQNCRGKGKVAVRGLSVDEQDNVTAGGVVGTARYSAAIISDCYADGVVTAQGGYMSHAGGVIGTLSDKARTTRCFSVATVHAEDARMQNNAGGLVGHMQREAIASNCGAAATVSASGNAGWFNAVGGFAGAMYEDTRATDCYSAGSVSCDDSFSIGGFVGRMAGHLRNCYAVTDISSVWATYPTQSYGIVGSVRSDILVEHTGVFNISNPHFYHNGEGDYDEITAITTDAILEPETYISRGWNFETVWVMPGADSSYRLPMLRGVFEVSQKALVIPEKQNGT